MANLEAKLRQCLRCKTNYTVMEYTASPIGLPNVLYVDSSGPSIYTYDTVNNTYVSFNEVQDVIEAIINLTTSLSPLDTNNPTTAEVQAWATANLTGTDLTNGTQLIYNAPSGGDAANPDYTWTVNDGVVTLSNKVEKTNAVVYVDTVLGSNTTGKKNYPEYPYKTFTNAITQLVDGDLLEYKNTNETISGANILPANTDYNFDFGAGNITLVSGGNPLIGANTFTDATRKDLTIKSDGLFTANKVVAVCRNGEIILDLNKVNVSGFLLGSKDNVSIKANDLVTTSFYPFGFYSPSNKNISIDVKNITVNNQATGGYIPGLFNPESSDEDMDSNNISVNLENVVFNTSYGSVLFMYSNAGSNFYIKNNLFNYTILNFKQSSLFDFYDHNDTSPSKAIFRYSASSGGARLDNNKIYLNVKNQDSDISVQQEGSNGTSNIDNCLISINVDNSIVRKLATFKFTQISVIFNNTKQIVTGNYINLSTQPIIDIRGLSLTNNSVLEFNGNFKSNTNISLTGLTIDTTSKIVFKGRYELGSGFFDISGVTGAGTDNIYFEDCTIVTNNTECIVSGTAKNIKVLNTKSNKPKNVNVTELISTITVNSIIN